jgi:hypothetical protein
MGSLLSFGQLAYAAVALARKLVELGEKYEWITEGERRFILKESLAVNKVLAFKAKVKAETLTLDQLQKELEGDFID